MSERLDSEVVDVLYEYLRGTLYLITVAVIFMPLYFIANYLVLVAGLSRASVMVLTVAYMSLVFLIKDRYVLRSVSSIDLASFSRVDPALVLAVGTLSLLLSLLLSVAHFITKLYVLSFAAIALWLTYLSALAYETHAFYKAFNNSLVCLSTVLFVAIMLLSFVVPIPYSYLLTFMPLIVKHYGLKSALEEIESGEREAPLSVSVHEQALRSSAAEYREALLRGLQEGFRSVSRAGVYLLIASAIELALFVPALVPQIVYVTKLPVLNIEPSYILKVILVNRLANWELLYEYLPLIVISTAVYSFVVVLCIASLLTGFYKGSRSLAVFDRDYEKLSWIVQALLILLVISLLLLIAPMLAAISLQAGGAPWELSEALTSFLNDFYAYAPLLYVFSTSVAPLLASAVVITKLSRDFPTTSLGVVSNVVPLLIFVNIVRVAALLLELVGVQELAWISGYAQLLTVAHSVFAPLAWIAIGYGSYKLYSDFRQQRES